MKNFEIISKIQILEDEELNENQRKVIEAAREATYHSYVPYSNFHVGAACLLDNGEIISGSNQENAAYPSGICAERTTLFYAHSKYPDAKILMLCIVGRDQKGDFIKGICSPCGACRQVILEAEYRSKAPIQILLPSGEGTYVIDGILALLPFGFTPDDLNQAEV